MQKLDGVDGVIMDSFSGNTTVTKQYPAKVTSLALANDGDANIEIDLGYCKVAVKPDEVFDDNVVPQQSFIINTAVPFRCIVRGNC